MVSEEGEYLPELQDHMSSRKGRSGQVALPAVTDEDLKIQTAKTEAQTLQKKHDEE